MMAIDWKMGSSTKFSMFVTKCNANLSQRFANMTVVLYTTAVILFNSNILVKYIHDRTATNVSSRLLVLEMDLPFDANQRFVYESVIIVQFLHLLLCSDAIGLLNALLINLVSFVAQKDIIIYYYSLFLLFLKINFLIFYKICYQLIDGMITDYCLYYEK